MILNILQFKWWMVIIIDCLVLPEVVQAPCSFSDCNFEGDCVENACECIGSDYFTGEKCGDIVDHCNGNACKNNGECRNFVGQFVCENCAENYGGHDCSILISNSFSKMVLHFQHYAYYGEEHRFLLMVENLGENDFSLELTGGNYAIALFDTKVANSSEDFKKYWTEANDFGKVFKRLKLRHFDQMPYQGGYYHIAKQTFWTEGTFKLTLRAYDTETATKQLINKDFDLLVVQPPASSNDCVPKVEFLHGENPFHPMEVDIARYNNFEAFLVKRCQNKSKLSYTWTIYNTIGSVELHYFGKTRMPRMKVAPYALWYNYRDETVTTYRIEVKAIETYSTTHRAVTKQRCFILLLPKPVFAKIYGGEEREIGYGQTFLLDGRQSRDFALSPKSKQDIIYKWNCSSDDDPDNTNCNDFKSSVNFVEMGNKGNSKFLLDKNYTFELTVNSKINVYAKHLTQQKIKIVKSPTLSVDIKCVRNCLRNLYQAGHFIHLKVQAEEVNLALKKSSIKIKWIDGDNGDELGTEQRLIYTPTKGGALLIQVTVEYDGTIGKSSVNLLENEAPSGGQVSVDPKQGTAYETEFTIKFNGYKDKHLPLSYEIIVNNFTVERTNEPTITGIRLPPTQAAQILICDELYACTETELTVSVEELPNADTYLETNENLLSQLLKDGKVRSAQVLLLVLAQNVKDLDDAELLLNEIGDFEFQTLLNFEQLLTVSKELCTKLLPLDHEKAQKVFQKIFSVMQKTLSTVVGDGEIRDITEPSYNEASTEIIFLLNEFSKLSETIPIVQELDIHISTRIDPIGENYLKFPEFNVTAIERINHWLNASIPFNKCFDLFMSSASIRMHYPGEERLEIDHSPTESETYAIDIITGEDFNINGTSFIIQLSKEYLADVKSVTGKDEMIVQIIEIKDDNNPFWWYPDNYGIRTDFMYFGTYFADFNAETDETAETKIPFDIEMILKDPPPDEESQRTLTSFLISNLHMPIFKTKVPANSLMIVRFLNASIDLRIAVKCGKPPRSYEVEASAFVIKANEGLDRNQKFAAVNYVSAEKYAYLAVLSKDRKGNISNKKTNFSFVMEIQQCLTWDFTLEEPEWSSQGCQAIDHPDTNHSIKCHCTHLSIYGGKSYLAIPAEDLRDVHMLLESVPINWIMLLLYIGILLICLIILGYFWYHETTEQCPVIVTDLDHSKYDIEVFLVTGGLPNAGSTANITFEFVPLTGEAYIVTVYQTGSLLQQNSICKFYASSDSLKFPFKLYIKNDQRGCYPSWYCKHIIINDWPNQKFHLYNIEKWINADTIEINSEDEETDYIKRISEQKWCHKYRYNFSLMYKNWYQFQPLLGPKIYMDLPRETRTCIWLLQLLFTILLVSCYYGRTTMKTYEEERDTYKAIKFYVWDVIWLGICAYIFNIFVHIVYHVCIYFLFRYDHPTNIKI